MQHSIVVRHTCLRPTRQPISDCSQKIEATQSDCHIAIRSDWATTLITSLSPRSWTHMSSLLFERIIFSKRVENIVSDELIGYSIMELGAEPFIRLTPSFATPALLFWDNVEIPPEDNLARVELWTVEVSQWVVLIEWLKAACLTRLLFKRVFARPVHNMIVTWWSACWLSAC